MKLDFVFASCHPPDKTVEGHAHTSLEIVYYTEGDGWVRFGDGPKLPFKPGFFHIAPAGTIHTQWNKSEMRALCVGASGSGLDDLSGMREDKAGALRYPCERLLLELKERRSAFELVANGLLQQIAGLIRRIADGDAIRPCDPKSETVSKALHIIRESGGRTNLDELSEVLFISKDYLRHLLTKETGRSPVRHLIDARMAHAAEMLSEGSLGVSETAKACGFPDIYYFSRLFKSRFKISPSAYRHEKSAGRK